MAITSSRTARPQTNYVATTGGTASYATASLLPFAGNQVGDEAFVVDANKLYVWDGTGWFNVAIVNETPSITTGANVAYNVSMYSPETVTLAATDPEGVPITWGYTVASGVLGNSTVSINGNAYTITAGTHATDANTVFSLTFTASDGINTAVDGPSQFTVLYADPPGLTHGWFIGGFAPGIPYTKSYVDRVDYTSDTATASLRGLLSIPRYYHASAGNSYYSWSAGGLGDNNNTSVDRIDYAADLASPLPRGNLPITQYGSAATGNNDYGWFVGSGTYGTRVNRIDYADDLIPAVTRAPLSLQNQSLAAAGNANYGWFGGGFTPGPGRISTVQRIDYADDLTTASTRGPLSINNWFLAAAGNDSYGWFGGGDVPGSVSTVNRIDYAADTGTATIRGPLSISTQRFAATGNNNYGWFGGGQTTSLVGRIDYAADTNIASTRGPLNLARYYIQATGGYPG